MKCTPEFFGASELPLVDISEEMLETIAEESVHFGITVPGVQKKLSMNFSEDGVPRLTLVDYPAGYILKPQTDEFENLPEAEDLVMDICGMMGVRTAPHGLIETTLGLAYVTRRVDRTGTGKLAMEDFCQISGRPSQDKYKGSYERCGKIIRRHSSRLGFDLSEFYLRVVTAFITGNSDMHLKNYSLIETEPGSRAYVLSPAYDLLPVNIVMPEDTEETALTLNGKRSNLGRRDFLALADNIGISRKAAEKMIREVTGRIDKALKMTEESYLSEEMKERMAGLIKTRSAILD